MKKIAIDARNLDDSYSGIAKYSENLLENLSLVDQTNRYTVFIHRSFNRRLKVGENFRIVPYPARPISVRTLVSFGRRCRRMGCDFLHSLSPVAPFSGIERRILTIHDLQPITAQEEVYARRSLQSRLVSLFHRATFPYSVNSASWLIAVSQATKDHLTRFFPETMHKTVVVHSGVEESYFEPPEPTVAQMVARKMELPERFVLYIGTAQPNKNLPTMIRAFARCVREHRETLESCRFLLVVGGRDRYVSECRRLVRTQGLSDQVRIIRPVTEEEKRVLYAKATVYFSVTWGEGFGFPIVEAQAAGLPVLAGNDASVPEVAGETAVLVDPGDEDAIKQRLADLLLDESLRRNLAEAGRTNVRRFRWRQTAEKVLSVYDLLM